MKEVLLEFSTQDEANEAVVVLSKGYKVEQWFLSVSSTLKPYIVGLYVPSKDIVSPDK